MHLIDTHAHLTYEPLASQIDQVLSRSRAAGVTGWITVGTSPQENQAALEQVGRTDNLWAAVGYHPHNADQITEADLGLLEEIAAHPKVAAVGETGLDYHYLHAGAENQQRIFRAHLDIAARIQKPVVIHNRQAFEEVMQILDEYAGQLKGVVFHCYGGNPEQTWQVLERGYHISFTGIVTFKKADDLRQTARMASLDRLMIETDCPYLSPEPVRRIQPNEPALLIHTAAKLAQIHNMPLQQFAEIVSKTSCQFFGVDF